MSAELQILAAKLADVAAERRKRLSADVVAEALDEIMDAIVETIKDPLAQDPDLIRSHIEAHGRDFEPRETADDLRPRS